MSDTKHTPTPWTWQVEDPDFELYLRTPCAILIGPDGKPENLLAMVKEIDNGAFIVRACNNFDALLEACKYAKQFIDEYDPNLELHPSLRLKLSQAIAAAELEKDT